MFVKHAWHLAFLFPSYPQLFLFSISLKIKNCVWVPEDIRELNFTIGNSTRDSSHGLQNAGKPAMNKQTLTTPQTYDMQAHVTGMSPLTQQTTVFIC